MNYSMEERSEELSIVEAKRNDSSKREGFQVLLKKKKKKKDFGEEKLIVEMMQ